jgi:hypothetical protein
MTENVQQGLHAINHCASQFNGAWRTRTKMRKRKKKIRKVQWSLAHKDKDEETEEKGQEGSIEPGAQE